MNIRNKPAFIVENLLYFSGVLKISEENPGRKKKKGRDKPTQNTK